MIVLGRIELAMGDQAILRARRILRGTPADLDPVYVESYATGCAGTPDYKRLEKAEVLVFLRRQGDQLYLHHGAAAIRRVPYYGKLSAEDLVRIVHRRSLPSRTLVRLIRAHGPEILLWLAGLLAYGGVLGADAPAVQAELHRAWLALRANPKRALVMSIVRYLRPPPARALPTRLVRGLRRYHKTFAPLGAYKRVDGVLRTGSNYRWDHAAFLEFMLSYDGPWVVAQLKWAFAHTEGRWKRDRVSYKRLVKRLRNKGLWPKLRR